MSNVIWILAPYLVPFLLLGFWVAGNVLACVHAVSHIMSRSRVRRDVMPRAVQVYWAYHYAHHLAPNNRAFSRLPLTGVVAMLLLSLTIGCIVGAPGLLVCAIAAVSGYPVWLHHGLMFPAVSVVGAAGFLLVLYPLVHAGTHGGWRILRSKAHHQHHITQTWMAHFALFPIFGFWADRAAGQAQVVKLMTVLRVFEDIIYEYKPLADWWLRTELRLHRVIEKAQERARSDQAHRAR